MTKKEVSQKISDLTGLGRHEIDLTISTLAKVVSESLVNGEPVFLRGFGSFILVKRKAKKGRNISKGTSIDIPEHFAPKMVFTKGLKEKIKQL